MRDRERRACQRYLVKLVHLPELSQRLRGESPGLVDCVLWPDDLLLKTCLLLLDLLDRPERRGHNVPQQPRDRVETRRNHSTAGINKLAEASAGEEHNRDDQQDSKHELAVQYVPDPGYGLSIHLRFSQLFF